MKTHELKCHPTPFGLVAIGLKLHEVRVFDRPYESGDRVRLRRWDPATGKHTGQTIEARIGHVTLPGDWGLPENLCVFSLLDVEVMPT